jgi:hypothetical protein
MELEIGGIYLVKRKPLKQVELFDCTNGHYKKLYNLTMTCKVLSVQNNIQGVKEKHLVCFLSSQAKDGFGIGSVDYLYTQWLEKASLVKVVRDLRNWPENARNHFLMLKGAGAGTAIEGSVEEARLQIAANDRAGRLYKENQEKKKDGNVLFDVNTGGSMWATAGSTYHDSGTSTATYTMPKIRHTTDEEEWVEPPDMPVEVFDPTDEPLTLKTSIPKPKKKKRKKKKVPAKKVGMHGHVTYTAAWPKPEGLSKETVEKVVKEVNKKRKRNEEKKELFAKLYGKGPGYVGYEHAEKNKGKPTSFKDWAQEYEAEIIDLEEEME